MNVHMKVITADNIDHMFSLAYSNNLEKLLGSGSLENAYKKFQQDLRNHTNKFGNTIIKERVTENTIVAQKDTIKPELPLYPVTSPVYPPNTADSATTSPEYLLNTPDYTPASPAYSPNAPDSSPYVIDLNSEEQARIASLTKPSLREELQEDPIVDDELPDVSKYTANTENDTISQESQEDKSSSIVNPKIQSSFDALKEEDKIKLMKAVANAEEQEEIEKELKPEKKHHLLFQQKPCKKHKKN